MFFLSLSRRGIGSTHYPCALVLFYGDNCSRRSQMHFGKSKDKCFWVYLHVCLKSLILGSERQRVIRSYSACHKNNPSNFKSDLERSTFPSLPSFIFHSTHSHTFPLSFSCPLPYLLSLLPFSSPLPLFCCVIFTFHSPFFNHAWTSFLIKPCYLLLNSGLHLSLHYLYLLTLIMFPFI